ncbi:hypothetical protein [Streptomyces sp. NPDC058664]|uniref:hypothetical protein n=1 Tax=unclassified Streptomyces TaxID=2593676 RepID=UPI00365CDAC1
MKTTKRKGSSVQRKFFASALTALSVFGALTTATVAPASADTTTQEYFLEQGVAAGGVAILYYRCPRGDLLKGSPTFTQGPHLQFLKAPYYEPAGSSGGEGWAVEVANTSNTEATYLNGTIFCTHTESSVKIEKVVTVPGRTGTFGGMSRFEIYCPESKPGYARAYVERQVGLDVPVRIDPGLMEDPSVTTFEFLNRNRMGSVYKLTVECRG